MYVNLIGIAGFRRVSGFRFSATRLLSTPFKPRQNDRKISTQHNVVAEGKPYETSGVKQTFIYLY